MKNLKPEIQYTLLALIVIAALLPFDGMVRDYIHVHDACRPLFEFITDAALGKWYIWPSAILALAGFVLWRMKKLPERFYAAWLAVIQFLIGVGGAGLVTDALKRAFARVRPYEFYKTGESGFFHWSEAFGNQKYHFHSFPSGHATTAAAVAMSIILLFPKLSRGARIAILVCAGILMVARIMVEAHYPSDVIAGCAIGMWGAVLARRYLARAAWAAAISKPDILQ